MAVATSIVDSTLLRELLGEILTCEAQIISTEANAASLASGLANTEAGILTTQAALAVSRATFLAAVQGALSNGDSPDQVATATMDAASQTDALREELSSLVRVRAGYEGDIVSAEAKIGTLRAREISVRQQYVDEVAALMGQSPHVTRITRITP
jgi:hypothetical protein